MQRHRLVMLLTHEELESLVLYNGSNQERHCEISWWLKVFSRHKRLLHVIRNLRFLKKEIPQVICVSMLLTTMSVTLSCIK